MRRIQVDTGKGHSENDQKPEEEDEVWKILTPQRTKKHPTKLSELETVIEAEAKPSISALAKIQPTSLEPFEIATPELDLLDSPRVTPDALESPEIQTIQHQVKSNRVSYIKSALGLNKIGTLEESFIEFEPIELALKQRAEIPVRKSEKQLIVEK